jgi:thiol-disulfide isomerase/thioredoxin
MTSQPKRQLLERVGLGVAALVAASGGSWLYLDRETKKDPLDALWNLTLPTPEGHSFHLRQLRGRPLLINFWATWCPPCVEELPLLNEFYSQYRKKRLSHAKEVQLLGIAADQAATVTKFLKNRPVDFPIVLAGFDGLRLAKELGSQSNGLPFSVWIDANGAILFTKEGQLNADELKTLADRHLAV